MAKYTAVQTAATSKYKAGWGAPMKLAASTPSQTVYAFAAAPPQHPAARLSAAPGGPKLRSAGTPYFVTGFRRPVISSVTGTAKLPHRVLTSATPMPANFCWQPQDLTVVHDQGQCGTCWAHSMISMLGDRVSAATNGKIRVSLSIRQVQECAAYLSGATPGGCDGNDPYTALDSLATKKMPLRPYGRYVRQYDAKATDPKSCETISTADGYSVGVSQAFLISEPVQTPGDAGNVANIENMKQHIYNEGPVIGTFEVRSDFMDYDGLTIYEPSEAAMQQDALGLHAIEIVGWGKDPSSGVSYWVCRNSWGYAWPAKHRPCAGAGFFYMKMGSNTCHIEEYAAGALPVVYNSEQAPKDEGDLYPDDRDACISGGGGSGGGGMGGMKSWSTKKKAAVVGGVVVGVLALVCIGAYVYVHAKRGKKSL